MVKLFGKESWQLYNDARNLVDKVAEQLRDMGFVLRNPRLERKPHFGITDPIIKELSKSIELLTEDAKVDESEGYGELEYFTPEKANAYMKMPERLENLEKVMANISDLLPELKSSIELEIKNKQLHQEVLNKMLETLQKIEEKIRGKV